MADVIWNPTLHPKGHDGKFVKKHEGVFTFLHTPHADSQGSFSVVGPGGHEVAGKALYKVGGFELHPPKGSVAEHPLSIDYALKPGESIHEMTGGASALIQKHVDGTGTVLKPTGHGEAPKAGVHHDFDTLTKHFAAKGIDIDPKPLDSHAAFHEAHEPDQAAETPAAKEVEKDVAEAKVEAKKVEAEVKPSSSDLVSGHTLHHPLGPTIKLQPGDKVYQHKKVPEAFLIEHASGEASKITSTGKHQKAPESLLAVKDTNFDHLHTESETHPVEGTPMVLNPGESLYKSKGTPLYWAVVKDGKVIRLHDKVTGEESSKAIPKTWQASLDKGTLVHVHTAPGAAVETKEPEKEQPKDVPPEGGDVDWEAVKDALGEFANIQNKPASTPEVPPEPVPAPEPEVEQTPSHVAVGEILSDTAEMDDLPVGTKVTSSTTQTVFVKDKNAKWHSETKKNKQYLSQQFATMVGAGKLSVTSIPENKTSAPAVKTPAKKSAASVKSAKPKKADEWKAGLPSSYVFEEGSAPKEPLPGASFWHNPQGTYSFLQVDSKGVAKWLQEGSGSPLSYGPKKKLTPKTLLAEGWTPLAVAPPKEDAELPTGEVTKDLSLSDFYAYVGVSGYYIAGAVNDLQQARAEYMQAHPDATATQVIASEEMRTAAANIIANVLAAREKLADHLDASDKLHANKTVKYAAAWIRLSLLQQKIDDSSHDWTPQDQAEYSELKNEIDSLPKSHHWMLHLGATADALANKKFVAGLAGLDFNPLDATTEQYLKYITVKGSPFAAGMSPEQMKSWTLADLGSPSFESGTKQKIEKEAAFVIKTAAVASHAQEVLASKNALAPTKDEVAKAKIEAKQLESDYAALAKMHSSYEGTAGTLTYSPEWGWVHKHGAVADSLTDLQAVQLVKLGDFKSTGPLIGSPAKQKAAAIEADFPDWKSATPSVLQALGATNSGAMSGVARRRWLVAHLMGDEIAKSYYEKGGPEHPGSDLSPSGAVARQALANYLAQQPWYHFKGVGLSTEEVATAVKDLSLRDAYEEIYPHISDSDIWAAWLESHKNLPAPLSNDIAGTTAVISGPNGDIELQHGDLAVKFPASGSVVVIKSSGVSISHASGESPKEDFIVSPQTGLAVLLAADGVDITPHWGASQTVNPPAPEITKPDGIDQKWWDVALGAEKGGDDLKQLIGSYYEMPSEQITGLIINTHSYIFDLASKQKLIAAPENIQRLVAWAASEPGDVLKGILQAVEARLAANAYVSPEMESWTHNGKTHLIPPGASVHNYNDNYVLVYEGGHAGIIIVGYGAPKIASPSHVTNYYKNAPIVFQSKTLLTPEKAAHEGYNFTQVAWDKLTEAEEDPTYKSDGQEGAAAYLLKQQLAQHNLLDVYETLPAKLHTLPSGVKAYLVEAAKHSDTDALQAAAWKIGKGYYAAAPEVTSGPAINPDASYAAYIANGSVTPASISNDWSYSAELHFKGDYDIPFSTGTSQFYNAVAEKIASLKAEAPTAPKIADPTKDTAALILTPINKKLDGMHTKQVYVDQLGEEWMAKFFSSDPNAKARVDSEHYANVIGRMLGFKQPQTFVRQMDGNYNYVQHLDAADGSLGGFGPNDLTEDQLANAMSEHILDWLLSNHDSHPGNLLRAPDGKTIIGIDKGQAFKHHHDDKLAVGYKPPENPEAVWYDQFYKAVQSKQIDQDLANRVAERVMLKAYQASKMMDARFRELSEAALEKRAPETISSTFGSKAGLVDAVMERKHALLADFNKLYSDIWAKAGWEWKINPEDYGKKVGEAHVQNGPQFAAEVADAPAVGKALFFNSPDLDDVHVMITPMKQKVGDGTTLLGHTKVNEEADKLLTAWLKDKVQGSTLSDSAAESVSEPGAEMPQISNAYNKLVAYAKTLATHASGDGKDGAYNMDTIKAAANAKEKLQGTLDTVLNWRAADPTKPYTGGNGGAKFTTLQQQDAWVSNAKTLLAQYKLADNSYAQNKSVGSVYPDQVPFDTPPTYVPSVGLGAPGDIAEKWKLHNGTLAVRTADGGHYTEDADGSNKKWLSAQFFDTLTSQSGAEKIALADESGTPAGPETYTNVTNGDKWTKQDDGKWLLSTVDGTKGGSKTEKQLQAVLSSDPNNWAHHDGSEIDEKSQEVQAAGKTFEVLHTKAMSHTGTVDFQTGKMKETKNGPSTEFQTGTEYEVKYGNVTVRYRPWSGSGAANSQKGQLQFEIKDWDGTHHQIDDVLDTMKIMGLDTTPADQQSLELFYWKQLTETLKKRAEGKQTSGKYANLLKTLKTGVQSNPNMSAAEELDMLRSAWGEVLGQDVVQKADFAPQFGDWFGQVSGRPSWNRPDDLAAVKKAYGNGTSVPIHAVIGGNKVDRAVQILQSGGLLPSEERVRVLGSLMAGMSSASDQGGTGGGSSSMVFTRQNVGPFGYTSDGISFLLDPRIALKSNNYAFAGDSFGSTTAALDSSFELKDMLSHSGSSNEMMVKNGTPVAYAVGSSQTWRDSLIAALKKAGITEYNGMPVESFVLGPNEWKNAMKKMWDQVDKEEAAK